jgi:hypothetical protein
MCSKVVISKLVTRARYLFRWRMTGRESRNVTKQPEQKVRRGWVAPEQSGDAN